MSNLIPERTHKISVARKKNILNRYGIANEKMTDSLTGLFNKQYADCNIRNYIENAVENATLFLIDIDNFSLLNEAFGYSFGNEIIKAIAKNLKMIFRFDDMIARIESDKFLVLMKECKNEQAATLKADLISKFVKGLYVDEDSFISASIGIVFVNDEDRNYDSLINKTVMALSYVKNSNRDGYKIYNDLEEINSKKSNSLKKIRTNSKQRKKLMLDQYSDDVIEALMEKLNTTDSLTGAYVYDTFINILKGDIKKRNKKLAVIYADVKNFRYINDNFGYEIGDKLLKLFCDVMKRKLPGYLYASRVYSDNIVIVAQMDKKLEESQCLNNMEEALEDISIVIQRRFLNRKVFVCAGVYVLNKNITDPEIAVSNANLARKEAKKLEDKTMMVFEDSLKLEYNRKMKLASDLPKSIEKKELTVYYQPKVESGTSKVVGGEALVRWRKSDGTFIYPNDFIPYFEESGLIVDVDYYVYDEVFSSIKRRLDKGLSAVPISMNVSRVHLESDKFVKYIEHLFEKYKIPAMYIEFELTENIYIKNFQKTLDLILSLKKLGVKISMDDFGSGYSSLNVLNSLPIDVLKIDKVFLGDESKPLEPSQKIIIKTVIDMATKLNMVTVCEGVESKEQNEFLTSVGCDMIQGFFYEKPMPEENFYLYLEEHEKMIYKCVRFPFDGSLFSDDNKIEADYIGEKISYCDGPFEGIKAVRLPGGNVGQEIIDINANLYSNSSYTISCWARVSKVNMWSSLLYSDFENGFNSIIPHAGDLRSNFRILERSNDVVWHDTGSNVAIDDGWHFYAGTYNSVTCTSTFYIDDSVVGYSTDSVKLNNSKRIIVGGDIYQNSLTGAVAEVRVFNQSLSKTDIMGIYSKDKQRQK